MLGCGQPEAASLIIKQVYVGLQQLQKSEQKHIFQYTLIGNVAYYLYSKMHSVKDTMKNYNTIFSLRTKVSVLYKSILENILEKLFQIAQNTVPKYFENVK